MCHDTDVIFFVIHNYSFDQHQSVHFILITKWFPGLFTLGASLKTLGAKLSGLTSSWKLDIYIAAGRIIQWRLLRTLQEHVGSFFPMTPTGVTGLVNLQTLFGLCSGPFVLTSRIYAPCFMFFNGYRIHFAWMNGQTCLGITKPNAN